MDSLSQLCLGAACSVAVLGRRTAVWKAALWGGIAGTLPDLDALIDFGDAVSNMTYHRAESHGLFYLTLLAPFLALLLTRIHRETALFQRWCLAMWLALFTHPLLDTFTIYGTQLLQPFSEHPFGIGSIFIIDPVYTLPLLVGLVLALSLRQFAGLHWNTAALVFSCLYLAWSVCAQTYVERLVRIQLAAEGHSNASFFVTPTPLNTIAWRIVVMRQGGYSEGFYSLFDQESLIRFDDFPTDVPLKEGLLSNPAAQRMAWFTHGFYSVKEIGGQAILSDLRMGQEPAYVFQFALARRDGDSWQAIVPTAIGMRGDPSRLLPWLWERIRGREVAPPR